jgi:uncharacterized membrane protein YdjX (TVP38/TMEM64 family)
MGRRRIHWSRERTIKLAGLALVLLLTVLIWPFRQRIADFERYGYPGIFLISLLSNATIILPVPGLAATALGGLAFNPLWVGLAAGPGLALGELTGYLAGYSGRAALEEPERYQRIERWIQRRGSWVIFILSAIPNPFFDLAGIAAGAVRFPLWRFLLVCWLGQTVKALTVAYLGAGSSQLFGWLF